MPRVKQCYPLVSGGVPRRVSKYYPCYPLVPLGMVPQLFHPPPRTSFSQLLHMLGRDWFEHDLLKCDGVVRVPASREAETHALE